MLPLKSFPIYLTPYHTTLYSAAVDSTVQLRNILALSSYTVSLVKQWEVLRTGAFVFQLFVMNETWEVAFLSWLHTERSVVLLQVDPCPQSGGGVMPCSWTARTKSMLTQVKWSIISWSCPSWRETTCTPFTPVRRPTTTSASPYVLQSA